jgi:hypothetical protein
MLMGKNELRPEIQSQRTVGNIAPNPVNGLTNLGRHLGQKSAKSRVAVPVAVPVELVCLMGGFPIA